MKFIKINYLEKFTYVHNFSQVVSMISLSFITPFVIGVENYGIYASVFAIPGFFHGSLETYLIRSLNNSKDNFFISFLIFLIFSIVLILLINLSFFDLEKSLYAIILFLSLIFRSFFYSIATQKTKKLNSVILSEWVISLVYLFILFYCYIENVYSYSVPILMICFSCIISGFFLAFHSKNYLKKISFKSPKKLNFIDLFGRLYEDLFITTSPLIIYIFFSAKESGFFRILISIIKALFKLFPYKYEVLFLALKNKSFDKIRFNNFIKIFNFLSILLTVFLFFFSKFYFINYFTYFILMLSLSGFVIGLLVIYPVLKFNLRSLIITLFFFCILCLLASLSDQLIFSIGFCFISLILYFFFYNMINKHESISNL